MAAMITTEDNPFDPRTNYAEWYQWDVAQGYNTCAYLDRVSFVADEFPEDVQDLQIEQAIDEIIAIHGDGLYKKVSV